MQITLFRDLKEENWLSMERYSDALASEFKVQNSKFKVNEFVIPVQKLIPSKAFNLYYTRYLYYPLKARGQQGDVNHVIDHSYGHLVYALTHKKTVVTCHDLNPLKHEENWFNLQLFKYSVGGLKRAAKIISDSYATKKDLLEFLGIAPDRIKVIPLGVEEKFRVLEDQEELDRIRKKFNLPDGKIVMHVGGSASNKNIRGVLRALALILTKQLVFVKVGSDFTDKQKVMIRESGLQDSVTYLGQTSEEDLVALYNIADVFVFPSFYEGFGLPVLEAMACGTPVVTSKLSALPEVAGDAAILVDPFNSTEIALAIEKVLGFNPSEYQRYVRRGLEHVKRFSWEKTAEETLKVYEEIYSNKIPNPKSQIPNKFQISNSKHFIKFGA